MPAKDRPLRTSNTPSSEPAAEEPADLPPDEVFHILQTFRRRESIRYLLDADGAVKMRDIAEHVAAREHETTVDGLTSTQRQRVYIPLYQSHLPKLDEAGVIEYEKSRGIVRRTDRLELFRPYLEAATNPSSELETDSGVDERTASYRPLFLAAIVACAGLLLASAVGAVQLHGVTLGATIAALAMLATASS